ETFAGMYKRKTLFHQVRGKGLIETNRLLNRSFKEILSRSALLRFPDLKRKGWFPSGSRLVPSSTRNKNSARKTSYRMSLSMSTMISLHKHIDFSWKIYKLM